MRRRLPLLITALLTVVIVVFALTAHRELRRALVAAAGERVVSVSQRLAATLAEADDRLRRDALPMARDPLVRRALLEPGATTQAAAQARIATERAKSAPLALVQLFSRDGQLIASAGDTSGLPATLQGAVGDNAFASRVGPFVQTRDTIMSEMRAPVLGTRGDTLGVVRQYSRVFSRQSAQLLRGLVGGDAVLLVGNATGDLWTDFATRVPGPSVPRKTGEPIMMSDEDGTRWVGAFASVSRVPWLVWVAQPERAVVAQANAFLLKMAGMAILVIALGGLGARALTGHVIAPLAEVTRAAEGIAGGDYSRRVQARRPDEVGRLSAAFNTMASAVEQSRTELKQQQEELEAQQAELEEGNEALQRSVLAATSAQAAAERSRVRAAAVVAGALDCIITMDHTGQIVEFNAAAEQTFGCAAADAIGRSVEDLLIPPSFRDRHRQGLARYLATGESRIIGHRIELSALRADASEFPVELAIVRVPLDGPPSFTCFLRDLSQRRLLEEQLQQSQRMDAVGRLAGGVAHDFNNILTVIVSYGDLLLTEPDLPETMRAEVTQIRLAADRATELTRQLLAFSRKQVMNLVVLDLNAVIRDMHGMLGRVIREDVQLQTKLGAKVDAIRADRGQLEQILMNLAVNARDAMPDGGAMVIETANIDLDADYVATHSGAVTGPHVVLSVSDTGQGMNATTRTRIFEPFFTTKGPGQGTGLGLATVYGIVKQSGGSIYVYSEPGQGTTFRLYFPRVAGIPTEEVEAIAPPIRASRPIHLLLVEDDPSVREATRTVIERLGYSVTEAPDVATALGLIRTGAVGFDIVLTDAVMPGQSGLEFAEILLIEQPELPVVLMSGYTEEVVNRGRVLSPNVVFIEKPFTAQAISRVIATAVQ
ncbi:MAG TPA: ATP-binding protein [Gemmatimonadaceae bacterium]|nr:ATP-binding protein [Gemmatimonadaceae bacterium]